MTISTLFIRLAVVILLFCSNVLPAQNVFLGQKVLIGAYPDDIDNYETWLAGKNCDKISDYSHPLAYRATTEIVLLCKALYLSNIRPHIKMIAMPSYNRALFETRRGNVTIHADSAWLSTISPEHYYITRPIFKKNTFVKGFYVMPNRRDEIEKKIEDNLKKDISALETLQAYTVTSSSGWVLDWAILKELKIKAINVSKKPMMCQSLKDKHADLFLGELAMANEIGFPIDCENMYLVPIRGVKVEFEDSRHFAVSKEYPNSKKIIDALELGLTILEKNGEIAKAMYPIPHNLATQNSWTNLLP